MCAMYDGQKRGQKRGYVSETEIEQSKQHAPSKSSKLLEILKKEESDCCWFEIVTCIVDIYLSVITFCGFDGHDESFANPEVDYYWNEGDEGYELFKKSRDDIFERVKTEHIDVEFFSKAFSFEFIFTGSDYDIANKDTEPLHYEILKHVEKYAETKPFARFESPKEELFTRLFRYIFSLSHVEVAFMNEALTNDNLSNCDIFLMMLKFNA